MCVCAAGALAAVVVVAHGLVSFDDRERSISQTGSFWLSRNVRDEGRSSNIHTRRRKHTKSLFFSFRLTVQIGQKSRRRKRKKGPIFYWSGTHINIYCTTSKERFHTKNCGNPLLSRRKEEYSSLPFSSSKRKKK